MAQNGLITINSKRIFDVDADPSVSGFSAPIGSLALADSGDAYIKVGAGDTDWDLLQSGSPTVDWTLGGNALVADSNIGSTSDFDMVFLRNSVEFMRLDFSGSHLLQMSVPINMGSNQIVNLADGTLASHAVNKGQLDAGLALKLDLAGGTMSGAINMGANQITNMQDPTLATDGATKGYVDSQLALVVTGASFREFCKVFTSDSAPVDASALSASLPFSDDEAPALVIGDFADGDFIMFEADSVAPKLRRIYDDAGTLRVTSVGVTQPAEGYLYNVRYNLLDSPDNQENAAGYILPVAGSALIKVYDYDWNNSEGIAVGGTFTPASGVISASDSVHVALEKLQGNIDDLAIIADNKWDNAGNNLIADSILGSVSGNFDIDIQRNAVNHLSLLSTHLELAQNLIPDAINSRALGSGTKPMSIVHTSVLSVRDPASGNEFAQFGTDGIDKPIIYSSVKPDGNSRNLDIKSSDGVGVDKSSGSISIFTGAPTGTGVRGDLNLGGQVIYMNIADSSLTASEGVIAFIHDTAYGDQVGMFAFEEGADLVIFTQDSTSAVLSGNIDINTGAGSSSGDTGYAWVSSGDQSGTGNSGQVALFSGFATVGNTGAVDIYSGYTSNGNSGDVNISTGNATVTRGNIVLSAPALVKNYEDSAGAANATVAEYANKVQTTDTTATTISIMSAGLQNMVYLMEFAISARRSDVTGDTNLYKRTVHVENISGTPVIVAVQSDFTSEDSNQLNVQFVVSGSNILAQVIGKNAETWQWTCKAQNTRFEA